MHGKLDPEELIMEGIDEPYSRFLELYQVDEIKQLIDIYGWEASDDIVIEMAGTQVSGVDVGEVYNKKWQSQSRLVCPHAAMLRATLRHSTAPAPTRASVKRRRLRQTSSPSLAYTTAGRAQKRHRNRLIDCPQPSPSSPHRL